MSLQTKVLVSLIAFIILIPIGAQADGGVLPSVTVEQPEQKINLPTQEAIIHWNSGQETLFLSTGIKVKKLSNLAWVIPVPSEIKPELQKADSELFNQVRYLFSEIEKTTKKKSPLSIPSLILLLIAILLPFYLLFRRKKRTKTVSIIGLFLCVLWALLLTSVFLVALGGAGVQKESKITPLEVVETKKVGVYDMVILKATDAEYMVNWLNERGYKISEENVSILQDYCDRDNFYFIVNKISQEALSNQSLREKVATPLKIQFRPEKPFYPLKMSKIHQGKTAINVYFISEKPVRDLSGYLLTKKVRGVDEVLNDIIYFSKNAKAVEAGQNIRSSELYDPTEEHKTIATWLQYKGNLERLQQDATFVLDSQVCKKLPEKPSNYYKIGQDHCYKRLAISKRDGSWCENITKQDIIDDCYYEVALKTGNFSLCEKITSEGKREACNKERPH